MSPSKRDLQDFISTQALTRDFSKDEIEELAGLLEVKHFKPGGIIFGEGESLSSLFILLQGEVEVLKYDKTKEKLYHILDLKEGSFFGEMSFIDSEPTSATIRAKNHCTVCLLERKKVASRPFYEKLLKNIAICEIKRLRATDKDYVESMRLQLKETQLRNEFGRFFIIIFIILCIFNLVPNYSSFTPIKYFLYSSGFLLIVLVPVYFFIKKTIAPISIFGLTVKNWKRAALEGIFISAILAPFFIVGKHITSPAEEPLFNWASMAQYSRTESTIFFVYYTLHCFIQEFIARGVIQGALIRFMSDTHHLVPIILVSIGFSIAHLTSSPVVSLMTFAGSMVFGLIYYRHDNLIGVTIIHYILGMLAMALGYL